MVLFLEISEAQFQVELAKDSRILILMCFV